MTMKKLLSSVVLAFAVLSSAHGLVTLPYTFTAGQPIEASKVNANDQALRDGINNHLSGTNPHNTTLSQVLVSGNTTGANSINFNGNKGLNFEIEEVSVDPTCNAGALGRLIWNTVDGLMKICDGTSFLSVAGTGVNTLSSVLNAGNSAGAFNLDMNGNQIQSFLVENRTSDGASVAAGRAFYRTDTSELKVCNGTTCDALGGAQSLASVLGVGATANVDIDFDGNQAVNVIAENLASDPGTTVDGRFYYNTSSNNLRFYNGSGWEEIGNTQTLTNVMDLGNSTGTNDLDLNGNELVNARQENFAADPGQGQDGRIWFNTVTKFATLDDGAVSRPMVTTTQIQTLTNKTISGISNTITNVQDSSLSSNVSLLNSTQTISGAKTFSTAPTINRVQTASSTTSGHIVPDLADDTFILANATQSMSNKAIGGLSLTSTADFNLFQISEFRVENRGTDPSPGTPGRIFYKTATGELAYDDGTNIRVLTANSGGSTTPWILGGNTGTDDSTDFFGTLDAQDLVMYAGGSERLRLTDSGDIVTQLSDGIMSVTTGVVSTGLVPLTSLDTGTPNAFIGYDNSGDPAELGPLGDGEVFIGNSAGAAAPGTLTGTVNQVVVTNGPGSITLSAPQDLDAGASVEFNDMVLSGMGVGVVHSDAGGALTSSLVVDADVDASAGIARSKLASGTNYRLLANNGSGVMSENAALTSQRLIFADSNGQLTDSANLIYTGSLLDLNTPVLFQQPVSQSLGNNLATGANATITGVTTPVVRLTDAALTSIDGVDAGTQGQFMVLMNVTGAPVTINDETGATAANRIRTGSNGSFVFQDTAAVFLVYDTTSSRWRMVGGAGGGKCTGTFTGTSITPTSGCTDQTWVYTGGSAQTFSTTGFGTIADLADGTKFTIIGSDNTNTLTIAESDIADGRIQNGDVEHGRGTYSVYEYNATLSRMVLVGRSL